MFRNTIRVINSLVMIRSDSWLDPILIQTVCKSADPIYSNTKVMAKVITEIGKHTKQKSLRSECFMTPAKFCSTNWRCSRTVLEHLELFKNCSKQVNMFVLELLFYNCSRTLL